MCETGGARSKRILFGTTALVAAGALMATPASAEEKIKLGLGGYMNNFFGFGDTDSDNNTDYSNTGLFSDGEIWFLGSTTLDNGITFGAQVELESFGASTRGGDSDVIDEDFAYVEGSFGRFNIGSENSAAYLMHYAAPAVGVPINSGWVTTFVPDDGAITGGGGFRTPRLSTYLDWNNDENIITYFTPRFAGFQLGVTYAPAVTGSGDGANFPVQANEDTEFNNGFAVGANYVETLGSVDLAVSGGFRYANAPDNDGEGGNLANKDNDLKQYSMGVNVGVAGFTVGGSVGKETSGRSTDGIGWDAGVSYGTGPWAVGLTYFQSEVNGRQDIDPAADAETFVKADDEDEVQAIEAGVSYAVGPGITASLSVMYVDWEGGNDKDADGAMGIVGLKYNF